MEVPSEQSNRICTNCDKKIPATNMELHVLHCSRNLERCKFCGEIIPQRLAEKHYSSIHAPVACRLCFETVECENLALHEAENCPLRISMCEYCNFRMPAVDLYEHQEICGSITGQRHIGLGRSNDWDVDTADRGQGVQRRELAHAWLQRRLLFTLAIAGVAAFIRSGLFPKKEDHQ